jgi:hypothetical protein
MKILNLTKFHRNHKPHQYMVHKNICWCHVVYSSADIWDAWTSSLHAFAVWCLDTGTGFTLDVILLALKTCSFIMIITLLKQLQVISLQTK